MSPRQALSVEQRSAPLRIVRASLLVAAGFAAATLSARPEPLARAGSNTTAEDSEETAGERLPLSAERSAERESRHDLARASSVSRRPAPSRHAAREEIANTIVDAVFGRIDALEQSRPDLVPEQITAIVAEYQRGAYDAAAAMDPEFPERYAVRMTNALCDRASSPSRQLAATRAFIGQPALANERALDCVATRGEEDLVLWTMMDAWHGSGRPLTHALEELADESTDPRTRVRLDRLLGRERPAAPPDENESPPPPAPYDDDAPRPRRLPPP